MADTVRTWNDLLTSLFADGQAAGSITPQDLRDLIVTAAAHSLTPPFAAGEWYTAPGLNGSSTGGLSQNVEVAIRLPMRQGQAIDRLALEITTAGVGGVVRFGIRADNNGAPGTLLLDAGTQDASATGWPAAPVAVSFTAPSPSPWLTVTAQGSSSIQCRINVVSTGLVGAIGTPANTGHNAYTQNAVTGALPAGFTKGGVTANAPRIYVRAA